MREERVHHDTWRTFNPSEQRNILNDMSLDEAAMQRMVDSAQDLGERVVHEPMALHPIAGNMYRQMSYFESETGIPAADQMSEWAYDFQASGADNLSAFDRFIDSLPERLITDPSDFNTVKIYGKIFGEAHILYRELDYLQDYDSLVNEQKGLSLWVLMMYLARDRFVAYIEGDWESVRRIFRDQLAVFAQFHWCWLIKWVWEKIRVEGLRGQRLVERLDLGMGVHSSIQNNYVDDYDELPVGPNGERF
ncbi:hypothetical protein BS50DRAFT_582900 [Corynespora cassiicola Philippines]|uniref:Uncharacterized protein n=1 Tax=Corynespora cassiicola Philippines TaxID=1448308 RepID=A0A2T2P7P4_CORCC|nr:hypothetical protein BS50DRAFT_582900 [Corynespora cassiicola Philippines]